MNSTLRRARRRAALASFGAGEHGMPRVDAGREPRGVTKFWIILSRVEIVLS